MKIMFLTFSLNYGGAERQIVTLAKGLHEIGHQIIVVTFYPNGPLEGELRDARIQVKSLNVKNRLNTQGLWRLICLLKEEKPDIFHGYLSIPNVLTVLLKPIFPRISSIWGIRASNIHTFLNDKLERLVFRIECCLSDFADLIIVNSRAGWNYVIEHGFPENKTVLIHNGIDTGKFSSAPQARQRIRMEWRISDAYILIGIVARIDPTKDYPTFLRAAALLSGMRDDVMFVCIGDGHDEYRQKIHALGDKMGLSGRLLWAGSRNDMPAVYSALDIATSSSLVEGFPNAIAEAMSCGVPCVATDVGDSSDIVGDIGIIVPPANPEALANGWLQCIKKDKKEMSLASRQRIEERFSVKQLVKQTEMLLSQIVTSKAKKQ